VLFFGALRAGLVCWNSAEWRIYVPIAVDHYPGRIRTALIWSAVTTRQATQVDLTTTAQNFRQHRLLLLSHEHRLSA
jgi:hypothetical protein